MSIKLFKRRLLNEPEIRREISGLVSGVPVPYDIQLRFDNADEYFDDLVAAEEIRGRGVRLDRHEALDTPPISFEAYGIIKKYEFIDAEFVLTVGVSREDPIWQTIFPRKIFEMDDFEQSLPNVVIPAKDLGKRYRLPLGHADKVYMLYCRADYGNDRYDYLCKGPVAGFFYVYRAGRLVDASEYTAFTGSEPDTPYPGFACLRFSLMQRDASGNLLDITADIDGLISGERNPARQLQNLLSNSDWGMDETVNVASFDTAAGHVVALKGDGDIGDELSLQTIRDYLLRIMDAKIERDQNGAREITVDTYQGTVEATFGANDGWFNNILEVESFEKTSIDEALKSYALKYRKDNWSGEFALTNKRPVSAFGEEIEEDNPLVSDGTTADMITSRKMQRALLGDEHLHLVLGMEARFLTGGKVVRIIVPSRRIDDVFQVMDIGRKLCRFPVHLRSYAAEIYQHILGDIPTDPNPDDQADYVYTSPAIPTGVALDSQGTSQGADGTTLAYKVIRGTAPASNFQVMLFGYRKSSETVLPYTWVEGQELDAATRLWKCRIDGLIPGEEYDFAVMCRNGNAPGYRDSAFVTVLNSLAPGDTGQPATTTGFTGKVKLKTWHFQWTPNRERDLIGYHIQISRNSAFTQIVFDNMESADKKPIAPNFIDYTDDSLAYGTTLYCHGKAVDRTGNKSASWSGYASATAQQVQGGSSGGDIVDGAIDNRHVGNLSADKIDAGVLRILNGSIVNSTYGGDKNGVRDGLSHWYTPGGVEIIRMGQETVDGWYVAYFMGQNTNKGGILATTGSASYAAIKGRSTLGSPGVVGACGPGEVVADSLSAGVCGVAGGEFKYGGFFYGSQAGPIILYPSSSAAAPTHQAVSGTLWVTNDCVLYINVYGGTTWQKIGAQ